MPDTTTTYEFNKPIVGGDVDDCGGYLNDNWDAIDDLLDGTDPVDGIDIDGGSIDGTPIGAATPSTGVFTSLTAQGGSSGATANADGDDLIIENNGRAGLSVLTPNTDIGYVMFGDPEDNDAGSIFYNHANDNMYFTVDGAQFMRVGPTGNVGIKSSGGPTSKLDVAGTIAVTEVSSGSNCAAKFGLGRADAGASNLDLIGDTTYTDFGLRVIREAGGANAPSSIRHRGTGNFSLQTNDAAPLLLRTNDTTRMTIRDDGSINMAALPTSSSGLVSGDLWNDSGTLKIV